MIPNHSDRQTGRTTRQMLAAPQGATFVWRNSRLSYPRQLASDLGRNDLIIRPLSWLSFRNVRGRPFAYVDMDHSITEAMLNSEQLEVLNHLSRSPRRIH